MSKALVIGGGIGGLSAAIGLRQAGVDVDVVEISPGREVYHVGIIVQANFMRALDRLGVADQAIARGFPYAGFDLCDKDGRLVAYIPGVALSRDGHPTDLGLTRPALHDVLSDGCARNGVTPRFGVTFEKIEQDDDKVTVTFTDGSVGEYDFVIGADGLFSKMRTELFGDKYKPEFTGQAVWRYNLPRPADVIRTAMYQGVSGGKAGYCPLTNETMYLLLVMHEPGKPWLAKEDLPRLFKEAEGPKGAMTRTWLSVPDQDVFAVAGIWRPTQEWGEAYAMVMTECCEQTAHVHDRMPVLLSPERWDDWLSEAATPASDLSDPA